MNTLTNEQKAELLNTVDGVNKNWLKTEDWMIINREYFDNFPDMIEMYSKRGYRINELKKMVWEYQYGETVSVRLLHQAIVDALYEQSINSEEMHKFIDIIQSCKWLEPEEYEEMVNEHPTED